MNELFNTLFEALDGQMNDTAYCTSFAAPAVDISQTKSSYNIEMDLPGKTENDINLELDRNILTISSADEQPAKEETAATEEKPETPVTKWLIKERRTSKFSRRFTLPEDIDSENISATFKNGVLNVIIPRKELAAPKKIAIIA